MTTRDILFMRTLRSRYDGGTIITVHCADGVQRRMDLNEVVKLLRESELVSTKKRVYEHITVPEP